MALHVTRMDAENRITGTAAGKGVVAKGVQRNVLGTITNKCIKPTTGTVNTKVLPALQKPIAGRISRSNSLAIIKETKKQTQASFIRSSTLSRAKSLVSVQPKKVIKEEDPTTFQYGSPIPMDIDTLSDAFSTQLLPPNVEDIDAEDDSNPQMVSEYAPDIFAYLRFLETHYAIREDFMRNQKEITGKMRSILVDWLVQVHQRFHLLQETLNLTVACLDRYLQEQPVSKTQLQLVGVTAMYVAAKYEEMYAPDVGDFVYITDNAYSKQGIFKMEQSMLRVLKFGMGRPLPLHFLRRYSKAGNIDALIHTIAKYIIELTLTEIEFCHLSPSFVAAAALCLGQRLMYGDSWGPQLAYYSGYSDSNITPLVCQLARLIVKAPTMKLQAVFLKYSHPKFFKVAVRPQMSSSTVKELAGLATTK